MKTIKNKVYAALLILCGAGATALENDATALIFLGFIAIPMFFAKENWIY